MNMAAVLKLSDMGGPGAALSLWYYKSQHVENAGDCSL